MITAEQLQALKKGNASVDAEKTKVRIPNAFKSASKTQKDEIIKMTGLSANTFYGVSRSGTASPRVVLSLSQILNISPYYLTGEIDEKEPCDASHLAEFFKKCKGDKGKKASKPVTIKEKPAKTVKSVKKPDKSVPVPNKDVTVKVKSVVKAAKPVKIDDESYLLLLKAVAVRAKFGGDATETYNKIISLLLQ